MFEITIYPNDIEDLKQGHKLIIYDSITGKPIASIIMEPPDELIVGYSKLPTISEDNPVSKCW